MYKQKLKLARVKITFISSLIAWTFVCVISSLVKRLYIIGLDTSKVSSLMINDKSHQITIENKTYNILQSTAPINTLKIENWVGDNRSEVSRLHNATKVLEPY